MNISILKTMNIVPIAILSNLYICFYFFVVNFTSLGENNSLGKKEERGIKKKTIY